MKTKNIFLTISGMLGVALYLDYHHWNKFSSISEPLIEILEVDYINHTVKYTINKGEIKIITPKYDIKDRSVNGNTLHITNNGIIFNIDLYKNNKFIKNLKNITI